MSDRYAETSLVSVSARLLAPPPSAVEPALFEWRWTNRADHPLAIIPLAPSVVRDDGRNIPFSFDLLDPAQWAPITIAPGATHAVRAGLLISPDHRPEIDGEAAIPLALHFRRFFRRHDTLGPTPRGLGDYAEAGFDAHPVEVPLNRRGIEWFETNYGRRSFFFRHGRDIYNARARDAAMARLDGPDPDDARAILPGLLLSGGRLYETYGDPPRRAPKGEITGLSDVFWRAGDEIRTSYGGAKIADPATFEALDAGTPTHFGGGRRGYRCSYGRDATQGYYFSEDTSTAKANAVRACKSPETLESLGYSYARDETNVYLEGRRIAGAHGPSFTLLGGRFGRDRKGIWLAADLLADVDPESFEVLPEPQGRALLERSNWGRDARGYIHYHTRRSAADYEAALRGEDID